ncbi:MAG TPA: hypothetical protein VHE09_08640 [Rhizomicrobium sp.]|nr:hypothetical protein [Rhizomicrobium sp.]
MPNLAIIFALAAATSTPTAPAQPPCAAAEHHQLDFWAGDWNVFQASDNTQVGTSHIERVMDGCGISEHYSAPRAPGGAYEGVSYSGYNRKDGKWHQMYVDTNGNVTWYSGGLDDGEMILEAPGANNTLNKMIYRHLADGSVEQIGTVSTDYGRHYQPGYDYIYRKK